MLVCDRDGTIAARNRRAQKLVDGGLLPTHQPIFDSLIENASQKLRKLFARDRLVSETLPSIRFQTESKMRMVVDLVVSRLDKEHWLIAIKDATRRSRMESHVTRLMTALDSTPDVFFLTDSDYKLTYVNASFQFSTGHTIEEALGRTANFLRAPGSEAQVEAYIAAVESGRDWSGELVNRRRDGSTYPVDVTVSPIFDRTGELLGYAAYERDITVRRGLQDEILAERNLTRSILRSMEAAVYALDREYRVAQVNDTWRQLPAAHGWLEVKQPPVPGFPLLEYVPNEEKRAELKQAFDSVLASGESTQLEAIQGEKRWAVKISPWRQEGMARGVLYQVSDHTQLHKLQEALYQAQKLEAVGSLVAGVAHDFNNLLMVIRGNTTLLLTGKNLPDGVRKQVTDVEQAASRASDIARQLLAYSRRSHGKSTVFDFNAILTEVATLTNRSLRSHIQVKIHPSDPPPFVRMDSSQAHQVIMNLCVNAQDAMVEGGTLELSNELVQLTPAQATRLKRPMGTPFLRCTVRDSGAGIPPEILTKIFDPFFTTKEVGKGTGLGLYMVQGIVTRAGGAVEVESRVGVGTVFRLLLPLAEGRPAEREVPTATAPKKVNSGKLLIVDDMEAVREVTRECLNAVGFSTFGARNATEALALLEEEKIDLMLTDYNMPGMNGLDLIAEAQRRWPHIKCILASGFLDEAVERRAVKELKSATLSKPYRAADAADLVGRMLAQPNPPPES